MQKLTLEEFKKATHDYERRDMMHWMLENCDRDFLASIMACLLYTSPSPRDKRQSRMPSSA